jgi:hypothetical protein
MKNFYDLLDIDTTIDLVLELDVIFDNGYPSLKVSVNQEHLHFGVLTESCKLQTTVNLLDPFKLEILLSDKKYNSIKETAVIIKSIKIDNIEIIPKYNHLIDYQNDHNKTIKTNYLGYNGKWILDIDRPFYQWYHQTSGQGWLLSP